MSRVHDDISNYLLYSMCFPMGILPSACLHISFSMLPPYSITLSPSPITSHSLPPSLLMPELLPSLPSNSLNLSFSTLLKLSTCCMPYCNPHFTYHFVPNTPPPHPHLLCTTVHCVQSIPQHDGKHLTLTYECCFHIAFAIPTRHRAWPFLLWSSLFILVFIVTFTLF